MREKVMRTLRERGLDVEVRTLGTATHTVEEAAAAVRSGPGQIAKSIVFVADGDPVVCVASGAHRVDPSKLSEALDCAEVRQASPDEVRAATGFPVGGVPPIGHGLPVVLDEALLAQDRIWAAGGDGNTLFAVDPRKLAATDGISVAALGDT